MTAAPTAMTPLRGAFTRRDALALILGLALAGTVRALLLPQPGLAGDANDFLAWARWIGAHGLGRAYDQPISFPPVMPWIWWLLGIVAPGLLSPAPGDPAAVALLKLPATIADFGIAAIVGWNLRARPGWAVAAALAVLLVPVTWYISAWWGQFESLYVLPMLTAWALLGRGHRGWAAVAIGIGLMTKPQALPLAVPFAAYYLREAGLRGSLRAALIAAASALVLWLPFIGAGGPGNYLRALADYTSQFSVLSLRAWNPWWMLQELGGGGQLVADNVPIVGPVTLRWLGIAIFGVLASVTFLWVWRSAGPQALALGLAATSLAAFIGLTTMHERYAYPAIVFLVLAWPSRIAVVGWAILAIALSLNLVAAVPPSGGPGAWIPVGGAVGIAGSLAIVVAFGSTLAALRRSALEASS
jgi:dolichyl-phosphate-mannose-protein mannosyltransferase